MTEERKGHGNKKHLQILLSPHRGELFNNHIKEILFFGLGIYWAVILFSTFLNI